MFFVLLLSLFLNCHALELSEKLTVRFLKVSDSKKTVLINRGSEDGLNLGDHGQFFITKGIIARGVVDKVSPTRSIWSLYRVIRTEDIFPNKLLNVKITPAISLTDDPSKAINTPLKGRNRKGSSNLNDEVELEDQDDLEALKTDEVSDAPVLDSEIPKLEEKEGIANERSWEAWSLVHLNSMSTDVSYGSGGSSTGDLSSFDFSFGLEKYFQTQSFFKNMSFSALIHIFNVSSSSVAGTTQSSNIVEYGLGASYHFLSSPLSYGRLIGFGNFNFGIGEAQDSVDIGSGSTTYSGSSNFFSLGLGLKYAFRSGFGARAILDYYRRVETYDYSDSTSDTKTVAGPRLLLGMSYRW